MRAIIFSFTSELISKWLPSCYNLQNWFVCNTKFRLFHFLCDSDSAHWRGQYYTDRSLHGDPPLIPAISGTGRCARRTVVPVTGSAHCRGGGSSSGPAGGTVSGAAAAGPPAPL